MSQHARRHTITASAAAAATAELQQAPTAAGAVKGLGFYTGDDGYLYCDNMRIDDIRQQVADSPFYLYSRDRITANYQAYAEVGAATACACALTLMSSNMSSLLAPLDVYCKEQLRTRLNLDCLLANDISIVG
jgi:hypothetical protein